MMANMLVVLVDEKTLGLSARGLIAAFDTPYRKGDANVRGGRSGSLADGLSRTYAG
jgi:hypothetical protein